MGDEKRAIPFTVPELHEKTAGLIIATFPTDELQAFQMRWKASISRLSSLRTD